MSTLIPFTFGTDEVRVITERGEPWFVAADVCRVLEIGKHRDAMARLDEDEGRPVIVDTPGGPQEMTAINESGLYSLILGSRKPSAKRFKKWVTSDVLPSIRKTGRYGSAPVDPGVLRRDVKRLQRECDDLIQALGTSQAETGGLKTDLITVQQDLIRTIRSEQAQKDSNRKGVIQAVRAMFEHTDLTDQQLAERLPDLLGGYCPEWIAWQRRLYQLEQEQAQRSH
jgi:prophage antirepressor-like protein